MTSPTLVVVSGPPGAGKTTLAHAVARELGCPAVCRDEIKEGMVHATPGFTAEMTNALNVRTLTAFFEVLRVLLGAGVTLVAEAAFQDRLWRPGLQSLAELADVRVVRCTVDQRVASERIARRLEQEAHRAAHEDQALLHRLGKEDEFVSSFIPISLRVPTIDVDTTDGYVPALSAIVDFARGSSAGRGAL